MRQPYIISKYAKRTVFQNRGRTILTLVGIIVATAMFTVVMSARMSAMDILGSMADDDYGTWHVQAYSMTSKDYHQLLKDERIEDSAYVQEIGYSEELSVNLNKQAQRGYPLEYNTYDQFVAAMSPNFPEMCNLKMLKGTLPKSENELIVPLEMYASDRYTYEVGNPFNVKIYARYSEGRKVNDLTAIHRDAYTYESKESLYEIGEKEYTIVGVYSMPGYATWEEIGFYTLLTYTQETVPGNAVNAYFKLKDPSQYIAFSQESFENDYSYLYNKEYIRMVNSADDSKTIFRINAVEVTSLAIIVLLAIMLIYNSFSTSSMERIRAIGLLKSVGATRRQIRQLMLCEAFYYIVIGIPLGVLFGNFGSYVLFSKLSSMAAQAGTYMLSQTIDLQYRLSIENTLGPVVLAMITIIVAIFIPVYRVSKIAPIEAVRVNNVNTAKPLRKSSRGIAVRLLGFTGALSLKNFFRYRKRYRATVLSVMMSILLIVFTNTVIVDMKSNWSSVTDVDTDRITYTNYCGFSSFGKTDQNVFYAMGAVDSVYDSRMIVQTNCYILCDLYDTTDPFREDYTSYDDPEEQKEHQHEKRGVDVTTVFIDDSNFRKLCNQVGVNADEYLSYGSQLSLTNNTDILPAEGLLDQRAVNVFKEEVFPEQLQMFFYRSSDRDTSVQGFPIKLTRVVEELVPLPYLNNNMIIYMPLSRLEYYQQDIIVAYELFEFQAKDPDKALPQMRTILQRNFFQSTRLSDEGATYRMEKALTDMTQIVLYGYVLLLSLMCMLNVVMTVITNILFRRKEYILLTSVGMSRKTLFRMVISESVVYFVESLFMLGLIVCVPVILMLAFNYIVVPKFDLVFCGITVLLHLLLIMLTTAFSLVRVMRNDVIEGLRKEYY